MQTIQGKLTKPTQTARPLADPDAPAPGIPDHVKRPADPELLNPMGLTKSMTAKQGKKDAKRRIKAIKRRLRSHPKRRANS